MEAILKQFWGTPGGVRSPGAGLSLLLALPVAAVAWLIVRGWGLYALGGFLLAGVYLFVLARWQRGVYGLFIYLPFSGAVTLALLPWRGPAALNPVLYKDWLFVLPAYFCFLGALFQRRVQRPPVGRLVTSLLGGLGLLVIAQMANPGVPTATVALIGAKVWLLYLPLYVLGAALVTTRGELTRLLRLLVVLAAVPCAVGIAEYAMAQVFGYHEVMEAIYGASAAAATQDFTMREVGAGWIERIPSTFSFVTQFFSFTLAMMVPCYALGRMDPSARWRRFGHWMLVLTITAGLLSGSRAAFVFVPFLLVLMYGLDRGPRGLLRAGGYVAALVAAGFAVSRVTAVALYEHISDLSGAYAQDTAYGALMHAIATSPMGSGTGTNTGPARYAFDRPELFTPIENYYAKVVYELGIPGLLLIWLLFAALIWPGLSMRRRLCDPGLRACAAALVAFLIALTLYSFKGWFIDLDPVNVYFWVFAGLLVRLPHLQDSGGLRHEQPARGLDGAACWKVTATVEGR